MAQARYNRDEQVIYRQPTNYKPALPIVSAPNIAISRFTTQPFRSQKEPPKSLL